MTEYDNMVKANKAIEELLLAAGISPGLTETFLDAAIDTGLIKIKSPWPENGGDLVVFRPIGIQAEPVVIEQYGQDTIDGKIRWEWTVLGETTGLSWGEITADFDTKYWTMTTYTRKDGGW